MGKIKTRFSDLTIKSKLLILILIFLLSHVLISFFASFLFRTLETLNIVVNEQRVFVENFHKGIENFYEFEIDGNPEDLQDARLNFDKAYQIAYTFSHLESLMQEMPKEEWTVLFYEAFGEGVESIDQVELMANQIKLLSKFNNESLHNINTTASEAYALADRLITLIGDYNNEPNAEYLILVKKALAEIDPITESFTSEMYQLNRRVNRILISVMSVIILLLIGLATFIAVRISQSIARPVRQLADNFKNIAQGDLSSSVKIDTKNEIGDLSRAFQEIQKGIKFIILQSKRVAAGKYRTKLKPFSEKDELTRAFNEMASRLQEANSKTEREKWLQEGISKLDDEMRGNNSVRELSDRIINFLSNFLNVEMGAIFVFDEVLEHLEFTGSIGIKKDEVTEIVKPGEGLIGKAAQQKSLQIITPKEKYHKSFSATGEIVPGKIYLFPMHYSGRIQAVIELAAMNELTDLKIEFLELIKERVSVNLSAAVARYRGDELLKQSLEQSKILKQREEELKLKLEENKSIQAKLTQESALLDSMLRIIPDSIHFKDTEGKFLRISDSLLDLFDVRAAEEIIGKSDFDFYKKHEAQQYFEEEKEIIETGEGFIDNINENTDESGNTTWTSVTKLPLYDKTGKCIGTFSLSKDITDIKKLETEVNSQNEKLVSNQFKLESTIEQMDKVQTELEREKALMDSLLNNLPDAVYFKDLESKFIKVSKSMPPLFGLEKPEELYGKSDFDFFDKEHAEQAYKDEQQVIRSRQPIIGNIEKEQYKDGSIRYVSSTKMPLLDEKRNAIGTFGISRDITQIKQLELEVREHNEALKTQQEELEATNEELKTQEEELRVANEELEEQTKILAENEKNLQVQQEELRVTNEEMETKTELLQQQKNDITEKNENLLKTQNELRQKAKELEEASQYKSEFLANMSHELRTPLNSLLILSKLLGSNKKGNLSDEQIKSVNIIHKSGNDLLNLINEILDLSKIEAGKMQYEFSEVATEDLISEIKQNFKPVAENKNLKLDIEQSDKFPEIIYSDKQRLMQIIRNLLSNAFKFTSEGGVTVEFGMPDNSTQFVSDELNHENTCFVAVTDTGVGIPKNKAEKIFEAFQQADGSISRKFGGTGLGLSISKQLTQVLGGEMHVDSEEGEGSTFAVYLPLDKNMVGVDIEQPKKDKQQPKKKATKNTPDKSNESENQKQKSREKSQNLPEFIKDDRNSEQNRLLVLIIHRDKEKAKKLVELGHKQKFNALVASNVEDGIVLANSFEIKAIILSSELSDSGKLKKLKKNKITRQVPVHMVSKIEDSVLENIEDLKTLENENLDGSSKSLESKITKEYKEILVVEDDENTREAIQQLFEDSDIIIHEAKTAQEAYDLISTKPFDSVILDLGLPDYSGKELLKKLKENDIPLPNIVINTARELSTKELRELQKYSESIVIKGVKSDERLMDEVTLFLHQVENKLPKESYPIHQEEIDDEGFKGKKVLVVDDDIRNIFALAQILEEREIEVLEAENGEVAIEELKNNPDIDLVLMDIMMPVMNGYEAMNAIRNTPEIAEIPIITLTAKAMKEDYQKAIDSGANDYISKPVDMEKLISLLKIWLFK